MNKIDENKKIKDKSGRTFKRGKTYINPINGKKEIFDSYITTNFYKTGKYKGYYIVYFLEPSRFSEKEITRKERTEKIKTNIRNGKIKLIKSINPITKNHYKLGDKRVLNGEHQYFLAYDSWPEGDIDSLEGSYKMREKWLSKEKYFKRRIGRQLTTIRYRCKKNNSTFEIDTSYAVSIFPTDNKCPITNKELIFGFDENGTIESSPSLDKIIPEKGYIKNNVIWVSYLVNKIKHNATIKELKMIGDFYYDLEVRSREHK